MKTTHCVIEEINGVRTVDSWWCHEHTAKEHAQQAAGIRSRFGKPDGRTRRYLVVGDEPGVALADMTVLHAFDVRPPCTKCGALGHAAQDHAWDPELRGVPEVSSVLRSTIGHGDRKF